VLSRNILTRYKVSVSRAFGGRPTLQFTDIKRPWQQMKNGSMAEDDAGAVVEGWKSWLERANKH
jgi:hypothetical protein